jgi:hypothetical protein
VISRPGRQNAQLRHSVLPVCVLLSVTDCGLGGEELPPLAERDSFVRHIYVPTERVRPLVRRCCGIVDVQ